MATYLPGVNDYIPQAQPFKPDFNFYSNALSFRQAKYDAGYEQLNTVYSSMLNGPMSRTDNKDDRDKFFKTINNDIQRMAGLDLSKEQNVVAAGNVFDQLLDNDYISKDMAWTRNLQNQQRRGQALKNCIDPKKCGGQWWEGGDRQLQYKTMEFQDMSRDQSLQARNVEYTSYQDVQGRAIELADKLNLNVSSITQDDGKWVITQTNGSLIEGDLYNMFVSSLGQDPKIRQYNTAKAYNQRMGYATSKMQELGSLDAANNDYFLKMQEQMTSIAKSKEEQYVGKERASKKILDSKIKVAESEPDNYSPGLRGLIEELEQENQLDTQNRDIHKVQSNAADAMKIVPNLQAKLGMLDDLVGSSLFELDMKTAANTLSKRNASIKREANPYGLANYRSNLRLKEAKYKAQLDKDALQEALGKDMSGYNTTSAEGLANGNPLKQNNRGNKFKIARDIDNTVQGRVSEEERLSIKDYYKVLEAAAQRGDDPEAEEELVKFGNTYMKYLSGKQNAGTPGKQDLGPKDLAYWLENSIDLDSDEIGSGFTNDAYNNLVKPSVKSHEANESRMSYLEEFSKRNKGREASINANLLLHKEITNEVKQTVAKVRADVMASGDINMEAYDMLYDEYGAKRSKEDFKKKYITPQRVHGLMKESAVPFSKGYGGLLMDEIASVFNGDSSSEIINEYSQTLSEQVDEFYDDETENLKFIEDGDVASGDYDQIEMKEMDDVFEELFTKHDKVGVANKYFDSGDDAAIGDLITGNIDSAYPLTNANSLVSKFVQESGANRATEYFIPEFDSDGFLDRDEISEESRMTSEAFAKQLFADIENNRSKSSSDNRTKYRFEYSPMLDGSEDTQYMRVFPSHKYAKSMTGSDKGNNILNPELLQKIVSNGIVIAYPTAGSNTELYRKSKQTPEEYLLEKKGSVPININNQYYQGMKITENSKGYSVNGKYLSGIEADGTKAYRNYSQTYGKGNKLNSIINFYNGERLDKLKELYHNNVLAYDKYVKSK